MGSEKQLCQELDVILKEITSAGFSKVAAGSMEKLQKISTEAAGLGMKTGKGLIDNFIEVLTSLQAGKSNEDSVSLRLTALEFYKTKVLENESGSVEEL